MPALSTKSRRITLLFSDSVASTLLTNIYANEPTLIVTPNENFGSTQLSKHYAENAALKNAQLKHTPFNQVNKYLGLETYCLLFDASNQFDVNAFTAICGTIVGGGQLILKLNADLEPAILTDDFSMLSNTHSKTLVRFIQHICKLNKQLIMIEDSTVISFDPIEDTEKNTPNDTDAFLKSQQQLIENIKRCATGHAKRPLVISANRGRGKSASLGMAVAELILESEIKIYITAPRKQQLNVFYNHLHEHLRKLSNSNDIDNLINNQLTFLAPDQASSIEKITGLLIVEEAGALPTQLLSCFLNNSNRLIFSTTIDGYEGNGQGFEIRFKKQLSESFPQYKNSTLAKPVRWSESDILESALNHAFILSNKFDNSLVDTCARNLEKIQSYCVTKSDLNNDEKLLRAIYQLLVNAHYQTRPSDLERILSQDSIKVFVVKHDTQIIAAALVVLEGSLPVSTIEKMTISNQRIPGHLLPQSLVVHQGLSDAASLSMLRIMRIAVSSQFRRQGLATRLIKDIGEYAYKNQINLLGTSFSLFTDVINFWFNNGFSANRIGLKKDSSTGAHTGEFLKLIDNSNQRSVAVFNSATRQFNQSFFYTVSSGLKTVPTDILLTICMQQTSLRQFASSSPADLQGLFSEIHQYVGQKRSLEMIEWQLYIFAKHCLCHFDCSKTNLATAKIADEHLELIFAKLIQRKSWLEVIEQFQFKGIKESRENTRLVVEKLLVAYAG